ncbi:hypothetical protein XELAEV_18022232mg [Xenopus laevis]|uniref:Uncharacterized protein n=1 Tax=Xenopus laevis TaxID=8355 RepID=A0A974HNI3_XENLA|nr:hypothetical protein XELAEV_18022232mg [Xenopus laevis]
MEAAPYHSVNRDLMPEVIRSPSWKRFKTQVKGKKHMEIHPKGDEKGECYIPGNTHFRTFLQNIPEQE